MVNFVRGISVACALAFCSARTGAQGVGFGFLGFGGNLSVVVPTEGLQDRWKIGLGGGIVLEPLEPGTWSATGEFGVTRLVGATTVDQLGTETRNNDLTYYEFSIGVRRKLGAGPWFAGVDGAYYIFDINGTRGLEDEAGILPAFGFRVQSFGVTARYKIGGDAHWAQLRFSFRGLLR
jgi:hypothetical protein